jgi:hypothetical protein
MNIKNRNMKEIFTKIRKLQALADSAAKVGSVAEAEAATLAITRLLEKHNLSLLDVPAEAAENDINFFGDMAGVQIWKRKLLAELCRFNYCKAIFDSRTKRLRVVGTEVNALVVIDMFNSLQSVYQYAAKQNRIGKSETASFFIGCVYGLSAHLEKESQTSVMHTTAIARRYDVKIDNFLALLRIKKMRQKSRKVFADAFEAGFATGANTPTRRTVQQKLFD